MKYYYYSDKNQQMGPFAFEELKDKRLKKSTLIWTDGFKEWTLAEKVEELKDILISEPPPLPGIRVITDDKNVNIKITTQNETNLRLDYIKEIEASIFGVILFIIPIVLKLTGVISFESEGSYNQARVIFAIASFIVRIFAIIWVVNIAKRQNRNFNSWGWFAFFLPSLTLMIIGLLKKLPLKIEIDGTLTIDEQIIILKQKAEELKNDMRFNEARSILLKIKELKSDYHKIDEEIANCKQQVDEAKSHFRKDEKHLSNGQIIKFKKSISEYSYVGSEVIIDGQQVKDCVVKLQDNELRYEIKDGKVIAEFYYEKFKQDNGSVLELDGNRINGFVKGGRAWIDNKPAPDGIYKKGFLQKVRIKDGVVI